MAIKYEAGLIRGEDDTFDRERVKNSGAGLRPEMDGSLVCENTGARLPKGRRDA